MAFVILEAIQYVFFGGVFQRMSSFLFGFLMFGIIAVTFISWSTVKTPAENETSLNQ